MPAAISSVPASTAAPSSNNSARQRGRSGEPSRTCGCRSARGTYWRQRLRCVDALQQRIERDLAHDITTEAALVVQMMRIPLAEDVIGPAIDGMAMIVGPQIDGQFVEQLKIELCLGAKPGSALLSDVERASDEIVIRPLRHARPLEVQRQRSMAFVRRTVRPAAASPEWRGADGRRNR